MWLSRCMHVHGSLKLLTSTPSIRLCATQKLLRGPLWWLSWRAAQSKLELWSSVLCLRITGRSNILSPLLPSGTCRLR